MNKLLYGVAMAAVILVTAHMASAQDKIQLRVTSFAPPTHWWVTKVLDGWAAEMAKRTNGKVEVRVFAGNSPYGKLFNQADQVKASVTDIAQAMNGLPTGRNPRSLIMEIPLVAATSNAATKTLWSMRDSHLAEDYKAFKLLALHCTNGVGIGTRKKKIEKLDDLKGLRIRVPNNQIQALMINIGAVPVRMGTAKFYESLERGIIDGLMTGYEGIRSFRLEKLLKYYYFTRISVICFNTVMNQDKYDSLPADVKIALDATTGDAWINAVPALWDESDNSARATAKAAGMIEVSVSDATRDKWRKRLAPVIDQLLVAAEKQGVGNAREIYAEMLKRAEKFGR